MGLFDKLTDTLFGDPDAGLKAQEKANARAQEFIAEMVRQGRRDVMNVLRRGDFAQRRGYADAMVPSKQMSVDALRAINDSNRRAQNIVRQGFPQVQAAILGNPMNMGFLAGQDVLPEGSLRRIQNISMSPINPIQWPASQAAADEAAAAGAAPPAVSDEDLLTLGGFVRPRVLGGRGV